MHDGVEFMIHFLSGSPFEYGPDFLSAWQDHKSHNASDLKLYQRHLSPQLRAA